MPHHPQRFTTPRRRRFSSAPGLLPGPPRAFEGYGELRHKTFAWRDGERPDECCRVGDELCGCDLCEHERELRERYHRICDDMLQMRKAKRKKERSEILRKRRLSLANFNRIVPETPIENKSSAEDDQDDTESNRSFHGINEEIPDDEDSEAPEEHDFKFTCGRCGVSYSLMKENSTCKC